MPFSGHKEALPCNWRLAWKLDRSLILNPQMCITIVFLEIGMRRQTLWLKEYCEMFLVVGNATFFLDNVGFIASIDTSSFCIYVF